MYIKEALLDGRSELRFFNDPLLFAPRSLESRERYGPKSSTGEGAALSLAVTRSRGPRISRLGTL